MERIEFKSWFGEKVNVYELVETIIKTKFVTYVLKLLYEKPSLKEELLEAINHLEKLYSKYPFEEDKYYLEKLKAIKEIIINVDRIEKEENVYIGYKGKKVFANYIDY